MAMLISLFLFGLSLPYFCGLLSKVDRRMRKWRSEALLSREVGRVQGSTLFVSLPLLSLLSTVFEGLGSWRAVLLWIHRNCPGQIQI